MAWWETALKVGVPLVTTLLGVKATKDATKANTRATQQAAQTVATATGQGQAEIKAALERNRADLEPWRQAGVNALGWLTRLNTPGAVDPAAVEGHVRGLPGFQFQERELQKAIDRRHAASGNRWSGRGLKEMTRWMGDNLYAPTYQNWLGQLQTLAGYGREGNTLMANLGANTAQGVANLGASAGNNLANLTARGGQIGGEGALATGAHWAQGLNSLSQAFAPEDPISAYYRSLARKMDSQA